MNNTTRLALAGLLLGSATLAAAQPPAETFAEQFRRWQSYCGGQPFRLSEPKFSDKPTDPTTGLTTADMQALSSEDPAWQSNHVLPASSRPTFARANPHGLSFEYYQAIAADSDAFKYSPNAGQPAFATATGDGIYAGRAAKTPMRIATDQAAKR